MDVLIEQMVISVRDDWGSKDHTAAKKVIEDQMKAIGVSYQFFPHGCFFVCIIYHVYFNLVCG